MWIQFRQTVKFTVNVLLWEGTGVLVAMGSHGVLHAYVTDLNKISRYQRLNFPN